MEIPRSRTSFFRFKLTTFLRSQSIDYDYGKAAKKSGHPLRNLQSDVVFHFKTESLLKRVAANARI